MGKPKIQIQSNTIVNYLAKETKKVNERKIATIATVDFYEDCLQEKLAEIRDSDEENTEDNLGAKSLTVNRTLSSDIENNTPDHTIEKEVAYSPH